MSATYNWAYKPGVANKYNININSSADNVRPSNACYIALFGNDSTGNGSRQYPYRTLAVGIANTPSNGYVVVGPGIYREGDIAGTSINGKSLVGDGDVVIDISYYTSLYPANGTGIVNFYNMKFKGNTTNYIVANGAGTQGNFTDCIFDGCKISSNGNFQGNTNLILNCVFCNISTNLNLNSAVIRNCTFYNNNSINISGSLIPDVRSTIFYKCNINFNGGSIYPSYSLFYQCNFMFASSSQSGGALYPGTPTGYTYISDITALRANYTAAYSTLTNALPYCVIADPIFNNINIGDVTLAFNSPADNLSYNGTYIGARSIAGPVKVSATEASGNLDFSSAVNLTINDNSLTITDTTQNSQVDTKLIANPTGRELAKLSVLGFTADRNGQYLSSFTDLATTTKGPSDTLTVPTPYLVETGAITYNGGVYQPGDRLTTATGQTAFTTTSGGTLREIVQAPERHTIMARFSDGAGTVTAGTALTAGYWYYVESGSVAYNSVTYNAGSSFKAVDTNSFSGTGVVTLALSIESFQHYEPGIQPTSNNTGDTRTGSIIRGNGDPNYERGGLYVKEFPINARFFQLRFILQVNNLKS